MGAIARRLEPASAAINAMTIPLRIQPVRCMACELPCASMLMSTLLDIIASSASFGRRYRTCAIGYNQDMTSVDLQPHPTAGLLHSCRSGRPEGRRPHMTQGGTPM